MIFRDVCFHAWRHNFTNEQHDVGLNPFVPCDGSKMKYLVRSKSASEESDAKSHLPVKGEG
jgi:hypothetical protein